MIQDQRLQQALEGIEQERAALLADVEGFSQAQLDFQPAPGSWSIGETIEHVGLSEQMLHQNVRELLERGRGGQGFTRHISYRDLPMQPRMIPDFLLRFEPFLVPLAMMNSFVPRAVQSMILANPLFKVRTTPNLEPRPGVPRQERLAQLRDIRATTLKVMESALHPDQHLDLTRLRWKHPLMGTHDIYGTLELLANHDRRHRQQIANVQKHPNFPAG